MSYWEEFNEECDRLMEIVVDKVSKGICPICDSNLKQLEDCPWPVSENNDPGDLPQG